MLYLAANLRVHGHEVSILDGYGRQSDDWLEEVKRRSPDLLGLSCSSFSWTKATPLVPRIRAALPRLRIAVGGPHPTGLGGHVLREMPGADYAVWGLGEWALAELCAALEAGGRIPEIPGLARRSGDDIVEAPPVLSPNIDGLPFPARDLVDMAHYRPSVGFYNRLPSASVIASRGCPRRCSFCVSGKQIAFRDAGSVIEEIDECARRYLIRHVVFWDEDIAAKKSLTAALCEGLRRRAVPVSWCASLCLDRVDLRLIRMMKQAGCWKLLFGLESGVDENLATLGKTAIPIQEIKDRLHLVAREGIETYATFMFGIPGETKEQAKRTIRLACNLPLDYALFLNFTPFPGTKFYGNLETYGRFMGVWSTQVTSFVPHSMTATDLDRLRVKAYRRFYLRPRYVLRRLLGIRSYEDWSRNFRGLVAAILLRPENRS